LQIPENQKIVWVGPFAEHSGYAYMNRQYVKGLLDAGWDVGIESVRSPNEITFEETKFFNSLRNSEMGRSSIYWDPNCIKIIGWIPISNVPTFKHNIIYTMMESKNVGERFIHDCNTFYNSSWTTTEYYADQMRACGVNIPVKVLPIGVDESYTRDNIKDNLNIKYKVYSKIRKVIS